MKTLTPFAALLAITLAIWAAVPPLPQVTVFPTVRAAAVVAPKPIVLSWDYPIEALLTNGLLFVMHSTTNVAAPQPWPVDTVMNAGSFYSNGVWNVPMTNGSAEFKMTLAVVPGAHFYYVTASNSFWEAESDPSNTLGLDPLPSKSGNLRATRGW